MSALDDKVLEYQRTKNKKLLKEIMTEIAPKVKAKANVWSGSLPDHVLMAEGYKSAKKAVDSYDPTKGTAFTTHLYSYLQGISRAVHSHQNIVRLPEYLVPEVRTYQEAYTQFYSDNGYKPNTQELSERLKWPEAKVLKFDKSLGGAVQESSAVFLADINNEQAFDPNVIRILMTEFTPEEKELFSLLTGFNSRGKEVNKPLSDTAVTKKLKISRSQLAYRKKNLENRLRQLLMYMGVH